MSHSTMHCHLWLPCSCLLSTLH